MTTTEPKISYSICAIDPEDGITVGQYIVYGVDTRNEAEAAHLRGESQRIAILEPRDKSFYDSDPAEYILSCDRLEDGCPA